MVDQDVERTSSLLPYSAAWYEKIAAGIQGIEMFKAQNDGPGKVAFYVLPQDGADQTSIRYELMKSFRLFEAGPGLHFRFIFMNISRVEAVSFSDAGTTTEGDEFPKVEFEHGPLRLC